MGPESSRSSACALCRSRGRPLSGRLPMDSGAFYFFLPVKVLSRVFRGKFVAGLKRAFRAGQLVFPGCLKALASKEDFEAFLRTLFHQDWVVYASRPSADHSMCCIIWPAT